MFLTLIVAATIGQDPAWYSSKNCPGWQGFGIPKDGRLDPQRWRQAGIPSVEYIRDGDAIPDGYVKIEQQTDDPYGFCQWINGIRSVRGLTMVVWSNEMAGWAAANSAIGFGHFVFGTSRRQNSGVGPLWTVCNAWLGHGPHAAALLDPSIHEVGIGVVGQTWTFSAR